jgi:hypothetical protein
MRIPQRHRQGLVTQQFLNRRQIDPGHHEMAGKSMTKIVESEILNSGDLRPFFRQGRS